MTTLFINGTTSQVGENNKSDDFRVVVCASGGGGNFQALIDGRAAAGFQITRLLTDRPCAAVERAIMHGISHIRLDAAHSEAGLLGALEQAIPGDTDLIVLAGFMPVIPAVFCAKWRKRIINTHPSLLPKYGGKGMYGVKVQEAVMRAGESEAGCTVHYVIAELDGGEIILQKSIPVDYRESPWQLGGRVFLEENRLLLAAVCQLKEQRNERKCNGV
jgi:phosphoribosylglycinamide formyltransferase-1